MFGSFLAIACALSWSIAMVLFKKAGDHIHPILLNLCKNALAMVLLIPTTTLIEGWPAAIPLNSMSLLFISGFLGIGIADAMVLKSLNMIGASRLAIVECLYSPSVIALSLIFLGEQMTLTRFLGSALIITAIICASVTKDSGSYQPHRLVRGITWGGTGLIAMAAGVVMIKPLFETIPLFWIITLRMIAGVVGSAVAFGLLKQKSTLIRDLFHTENKSLIFLACLLGTYVSMSMWVASYKYNDATVAAVLNQTSTIFTVLLASLMLKERLTWPKIAGTVLAVSGVVLMACS